MRRAAIFAPRFRAEFFSLSTQVAESVDALVSNTSEAIRAGSTPALGTQGSAGLPTEGRFNSRPGCQMAICWVYALTSLQRSYVYVGLTEDLEDRILRHQSGRERTTKPYRPFELLYSELCADRAAARQREKYLKSGQGKEYLHGLAEQRKVSGRR